MDPLDIDAYLWVASAVLDTDVTTVTRITNIPLAESALYAPFATFGGVEFYPEPHQKAGVLCSRLIRNHPLPVEGNKRCAYVSMIMLLDLNGIGWKSPSDLEVDRVLNAVADRTMSEPKFIEWVEHNIATSDWARVALVLRRAALRTLDLAHRTPPPA